MGAAGSDESSTPALVSLGSVRLAELLRRTAQHDADAFQDVYRFTSAKLFGICLRILPTRQEAEDVLQDIYLSVWQRAGSFDGARGSPMTWLITIARNRAIDRLRSRGTSAASPLEAADEVADPQPLASDTLETAGEERRLHAGIDSLEPGDAAFLRAAFLEGASYPDIARRAGLPLGTVKSRIRRALIKLRVRME